jgi:hypothetical protein
MANWIGQFTDALLSLHPRLSGRVDWDAAHHYYYAGVSVEDAVFQYCLARNIE